MNWGKRQNGVTVLELVFVGIIFTFMLGIIYLSLRTSYALFATSSTLSQLQDSARNALNAITNDLRESGRVTVNGLHYPHFYEDGEPAGGFTYLYHPPADHRAKPGEDAYGPTREIIFRKPLPPADVNNDGVPENPAVELQWQSNDFSYVLVTVNGINELQKRENTHTKQVLARYVERVTFDDYTTDAAIPVNAVAIELWLRREVDKKILQAHASAMVYMRNAQEEF